MQTKSIKLYGVVLPIIIVAVAIAAGGYFFLGKNGGNFGGSRDENTVEVRRLKNFPQIIPGSKEVDKEHVVIKSQQELDDFLSSLDDTGLLTVEDDINFDKEFVIGVHSKTHETDGFDLKIKRVYNDEDDKTLLVSRVETKPGDSCVDELDNTPTIAVDIVTIEQTDYKIEFELLRETKVCGSDEDDEDSAEVNPIEDDEDVENSSSE